MMQFATCNATNMRLHSQVEKSLHVAPHFATLKMLYCEPQETCNNATQVFYPVHAAPLCNLECFSVVISVMQENIRLRKYYSAHDNN